MNLNLTPLHDTNDRAHTRILSETLAFPNAASLDTSLPLLRNIVDSSLAILRSTVGTSLANTIQACKPALELLATSWIATGAKAFSIWNEEHLLFCRPAEFREVLEGCSDVHTMLWAPLIVAEQAVGHIKVIGLEDPLEQARLEAESELIAYLIRSKSELEAAQTELVAREYLKTELDLAESIQMHLLPDIFPQLRDLEVYAHCIPARQVGGDFYNINAHEGRPLVFAAGDVSGKGLQAAMLMAMTRIVLHAAARFMPTINPRAIISRVNEDLYDDFTSLSMFATVFVGCYDERNQQLSYANAGHSPVIYCPSGGKAVMFEADGPAVGVLPTTLCENMSIPFNPGDVLVVATDGFCEAQNMFEEMFGYERLLHMVEELSTQSAQQIAKTMFASIEAFADGQEQTDDQTLIIIKRVIL